MPHLMLKDLPRYDCLLKAAEDYPNLDPSACEVYLHLLRTGDDLFGAKSAFLSQRGISQGRFTVLLFLDRAEGPGYTPAELAEESGVTRATMTGLIDTLEKDGLVVRKADPEDRRAIQVCLTPQGRELIRKILPDYFNLVSSIIAPLNETERKQLVALLQKLRLGGNSEAPEKIEGPEGTETPPTDPSL